MSKCDKLNYSSNNSDVKNNFQTIFKEAFLTLIESVYPKCHSVFLKKLKYETRNKVLVFVSIPKLIQKTSK